jgi:hypothetical protein
MWMAQKIKMRLRRTTVERDTSFRGALISNPKLEHEDGLGHCVVVNTLGLVLV